MKKQTISRSALTQFSSFSADFGNQNKFEAFLEKPFETLNDLNVQIEKKATHYTSESRAILVNELSQQLNGELSEKQQNNLDLLKNETTFTVTTGHQLTLFGGPMYLLYKVLHVAKLAQEYNSINSENKLVPIFWMASEDHDFEEVRHAHLFNQKISWNSAQSGAVGDMNMDDFNEVKDQFSSFFAGKETSIQELLAVPNKENYAAYIQVFLTRLFSELGVLVLQPNTRALKALAIAFFKEELLKSGAIEEVEKTSKLVEQLGYNRQATPREINLFYLKSQARLRIERGTSGYVIDGEVWSQESLLKELEEHPERFSPNVILRPVYQETILPNLVYVGGGGEMAYWIQLKGVFQRYGVQFPLIQQRASLHLIDQSTKKKSEKTGLSLDEFFQSKEHLRKAYLQKHAGEEVDFSEVNERFREFREVFLSKAKSVEPVLESMVEAELVRIEKQKEGLEQRIVKQLKQKHEGALSAIDFVVDKFIPENTLQERYFHWGQFVPSGEIHEFLHELFVEIDPFEKDLIVLDLSE